MNLEKSFQQIIVSKTRLKILRELFRRPADAFYVRELVRATQEEINSVRRELANLASVSIIQSEWRGNRRFYWANLRHPLFDEILNLVKKSSGFGKSLIKSRQKIGDIKFLIFTSRLLYPSSLPSSPEVDFLAVGDLVLPEIGALVRQEEKALGREINYAVLSLKDFTFRKKNRDPFILQILFDRYLLIIGQAADLAAI